MDNEVSLSAHSSFVYPWNQIAPNMRHMAKTPPIPREGEKHGIFDHARLLKDFASQ
jgi:hypothetical protein